MINSGEASGHQFLINSNNQTSNQWPCICPPCQSPINFSSVLSYSCYAYHTVMIKNDGKAYALGVNTDFRISKTLPKDIIKTEKEIIIHDGNNS